MSPFLLENMLVVYSVILETCGKFYKKNKNNKNNKKKKGNVCMKTPFCPTGKEF